MKKLYEAPDIEVVKFSLKTSVLAASGDDPENTIGDDKDKTKVTIDDFDPFG